MAKEIPLTQGKVAIVDDDWYDMLSLINWSYANGYAVRTFFKPRSGISVGMLCENMHRLILDTPKKKYVDHINGNKLDNRISNLRLCSNAQNQYNRAKHIVKSSAFKGVFWCNTRQKWYVKAKIDGKQKYIGTFINEADAVRAYQNFCIKHHGEFNVMRRELCVI